MDAEGKLAPGPANIKISRKAKEDKIILIPSNNKRLVDAVKFVFDLYTRVGLSRRKIPAEMNSAGFKFYDKPFSLTD